MIRTSKQWLLGWFHPTAWIVTLVAGLISLVPSNAAVAAPHGQAMPPPPPILRVPAPPAPPVLVLAPPAPPAPPRLVTPRHLALARELISVLPIDAQLDRTLTQLTPMMTTSVIGALRSDPRAADAAALLDQPGVQARFQRILGEEFLRAFRSHYPEVHDEAARVYAENFTEEELAQLTAFYRSDLGQRTLAVQPRLQASLGQAGQRIGTEAGREAMVHTLQRLRGSAAAEGPKA